MWVFYQKITKQNLMKELCRERHEWWENIRTLPMNLLMVTVDFFGELLYPNIWGWLYIKKNISHDISHTIWFRRLNLLNKQFLRNSLPLNLLQVLLLQVNANGILVKNVKNGNCLFFCRVVVCQSSNCKKIAKFLQTKKSRTQICKNTHMIFWEIFSYGFKIIFFEIVYSP